MTPEAAAGGRAASGTLQTKLAATGILARSFRITGQGLLQLFGADFTGAAACQSGHGRGTNDV